MDVASLWIAFVSAGATIASAVFAGFAMANSARAERRAEAAALRADEAQKEALAAQRAAVQAHEAAAGSLGEMTAYLTTEPAQLRRREVCLGLLNAWFDLVSLPGQGKDMWHSEEHGSLIDAERRVVFEFGSGTSDAAIVAFEREAFDHLRDKQVRGVWDEEHCNKVRGLVGATIELVSKGPRTNDWWDVPRAKLSEEMRA